MVCTCWITRDKCSDSNKYHKQGGTKIKSRLYYKNTSLLVPYNFVSWFFLLPLTYSFLIRLFRFMIQLIQYSPSTIGNKQDIHKSIESPTAHSKIFKARNQRDCKHHKQQRQQATCFLFIFASVTISYPNSQVFYLEKSRKNQVTSSILCHDWG